MSSPLCATTTPQLTAREAIAWWQSVPRSADSGPAVGYAISAAAATWFRLDDDVPATATGAVPFDGVYELVGFDGARELRWRNQTGGRGPAVVLADDTAILPLGHEPGGLSATRINGSQQRILAGQVRRTASPGWFRLTAARYAPADVPVVVPDGFDLGGRGHDTPIVVLESVEYAHEDDHGNLTVIDQRRTGLRLRTRQDLHLDLRES